jgi:CDP-glucose 4,6-dehydratase
VVNHPFWRDRRVLVTGHTGFKGAWLSLWLERLGASVVGLALPPESDEGAFTAMGPWPALSGHHADLRDAEAVRRIVEGADADVVFHLGAQALVRRAWADPRITYETNVVGTSNLLEAIARARTPAAIVVVTSDKVYMNGEDVVSPFTEASPLGGADPYSASKAGTEHVVTAWRHGHPQTRIATARAGNVIGGGDTAEDRLLPDVWRALGRRHEVRLRHPAATRPWQFVLEPLAGYLALAECLATTTSACPTAVNFGPRPEDCRPVGEVVEAALRLWGAGSWAGDPGSHPPEASRLTLDSQLAWEALGWRSRLALDEAVGWTIDWWRAARDRNNLRELATGQLAAYEDRLA